MKNKIGRPRLPESKKRRLISVKFKRGFDCGYAIFEGGKVVEIFVRPKRQFAEFKKDEDGNDRDIESIIEELNEDWLIKSI